MGSGFSYQSTAGDTDPVMYDIGPGESSSLFTFIDPMGGTPLFYITNSDGAFEYITPTGNATPEPSTWAMLIAGFGFLGWRYARRGGMRKLVGAA